MSIVNQATQGLIPFIAVISIAACQVLEPEFYEGLPILGDSGIGIEFSVPDSVVRGAPFTASFTYRGSSSCTKDIQIQSDVVGAVATLDPRVRVLSGVCTLDLHGFQASQSLQFNNVGEAQVRLRGIFDGRDT